MCEGAIGTRVRVLVVDDSVFVRKRLETLLGESLEAEVRCLDVPLSHAGAILRECWADVVVASCHPLDPSGTATVRAIRRMAPATPVIVLSSCPCGPCRDECLAAGADAYLDKSLEFDRIPQVVQSVVCGAG